MHLQFLWRDTVVDDATLTRAAKILDAGYWIQILSIQHHARKTGDFVTNIITNNLKAFGEMRT